MATSGSPALPHRPSMDEIAAGHKTKSDKIRALSKAGYSRAEVARYLGIRYQHVRNVLVEDERLGGQAGAPPSDTRFTEAPVSPPPAGRLDPTVSNIESDGRVALPPEFRRALGLKENDSIILTLDGESIRLMSLPASVRQAQAFVRQLVPAGVSLVDELLAERREEAKRENENG